MAKTSWNHALVWVSLAGALAGCSTVPDSQRLEGPPMKVPDAATIGSEPVPRTEPPSRSGNPDTYVVFGRRYRVQETSAGYRERGVASWYGWEFHGRKTSSGPLFNMFDLTAAHKSLPLPTYVRVTNLDNGLSTVVKVTDRGPFVGMRLIDLSYAAAARLGMLERGTAPVEVVALEPYQFLPNLAARRAAQRELLASRALEAKPKFEVAAIEFAHAAPIRPSVSARTPGQPPVRLLASLERNSPPTKALVRPRLAEVERAAPQTMAKAPVRLVLADNKRNPPPAKAPVRLALANVERAAPKAVAKPVDAKLAKPDDHRNPGRLVLASGDRGVPRAVAKTTNAKLTGTDDSRNPRRASLRPSSTLPVLKGKETTAKPPLPATTVPRNVKPVPARQAGESAPVAVRLAGLRINRSRGVAD